MGCLVLNATKVTDIVFEVRVNDPFNFEVAKKGQELTYDVNLLPQIDFSVARKGEELSIDCSLVCRVRKEFYLRVEPEIVWLTPDMGVDVNVWSNVNWYIE